MSAEQIFNSIGFHRPIGTNSPNIIYAKYLEDEKEFIYITFDRRNHVFTVTQPKLGKPSTHQITMEELRAINAQVKEMGWE